ncbi:MAG: DPP IV N-terminal domain-containing protein [Acidobacteriota bacterium]
MKRCPECMRDYHDETLLYCLDDGTPLLDGPASEVSAGEFRTAVLPNATTVTGDAPTVLMTSPANAASGAKARWLVAALAIVGLAAGSYWFVRSRDAGSATPPQPKLTQLTFAEGIEEYPAWSPDGTRVAYTGEVGGVRKIFVKELASGEERQLTQGDGDEIQAAWSPDGAQILFVRAQKTGEKLQPADVFGAFDGGDIWMLDIQSAAEKKIVENAYNPAFSLDGKSIAYDASRSGPRRIWTSDSNGHNPQQISTDVSEESSHVRPRWSTDGKRLVFQNIERTKFNIRTVELDGRKMTSITNDVNNNLNPVWSGNNHYVYFSSDRGGGYNIWRARVSSAGEPEGQPQQVTTGAGQDVELAISADGTRLGFSVLRQNADLWRLPLSPGTGKPTGEPEQVVSTTREDSRGSWSPDGSRIAFNSDRAGDMNIWVYTLADRTTRQVTRGPGGDFQPTWSPDGKRLVFFSSRTGNADIWSADLETGSVKQLTRDGATDINPFYSPDGKLIAYQSDRTGRPDVWLMNADGTGERQLTQAGVRGHFIRWNKAGDAVVFRGVDGSGWKVLEAPIDGRPPADLPGIKGGAHLSFGPSYDALMDVVSHKTLWVSPIGHDPRIVFEFTDPDIRIDYPVWSPDGRWVLFDRFLPEGGDIWTIENFE